MTSRQQEVKESGWGGGGAVRHNEVSLFLFSFKKENL